MRRISDGMFLEAARALANSVTKADLSENALYPQLDRIRQISHDIACAALRRAIDEGLADPELASDLEVRVRSSMWFPDYRPFVYEP